jgi:hypothetical protein
MLIACGSSGAAMPSMSSADAGRSVASERRWRGQACSAPADQIRMKNGSPPPLHMQPPPNMAKLTANHAIAAAQRIVRAHARADAVR